MAVAASNQQIREAGPAPEMAPRFRVRTFAAAQQIPHVPAYRVVGAIVALGLLLRLYHFLRDPSVWHDEAALVLNAVGKDFAALLGPLFYSEAAPPLFLWIERSAFLLMGGSTFALRLFPFLASSVALILFGCIARRVLHPTAAPWAVLLMACSDRLLWHACEAKPYSSDTLVAVVLAATYCWSSSWRLERRCLVFAILAPVLIFLAYPACFLYGGLLAALTFPLMRDRRATSLCAYGALCATVGTAFMLLLLGPIHAQRCAPMEQCWVSAFPPWDQPLQVPWWTVRTVLGVFDYCCRPEGGLLFILAVIGAISLRRRAQGELAVMFAAPAALALLASCIRAYPFTGSRVLAYAAPGLFLVVAEGALPTARWLLHRIKLRPDEARASVHVVCDGWKDGVRYTEIRTEDSRPSYLSRLTYYTDRLAFALLAGQLLLPLGWSIYRVVSPWARADFASAAAFIQEHRQAGDQLVSNAWEADYYFRDWAVPAAEPKRRWLVLAAKLPTEERLPLAEEFSPGNWRTLAQHEFTGISVLLQESADNTDQALLPVPVYSNLPSTVSDDFEFIYGTSGVSAFPVCHEGKMYRR